VLERGPVEMRIASRCAQSIAGSFPIPGDAWRTYVEKSLCVRNALPT
jgi:hypothetical protein